MVVSGNAEDRGRWMRAGKEEGRWKMAEHSDVSCLTVSLFASLAFNTVLVDKFHNIPCGEIMVNCIYAGLSSKALAMHPFTHRHSHQCQLAIRQGAGLTVRSNLVSFSNDVWTGTRGSNRQACDKDFELAEFCWLHWQQTHWHSGSAILRVAVLQLKREPSCSWLLFLQSTASS